ncbi:putative type II DNA modification methylase [Neisseria meningitidis]|nr:putative type II DNA modification methylase [Neisseria meningitidis]
MMLKTLTFAALHFSTAFSITYVLTGSIGVSGAVALVEPLINTVVFYSGLTKTSTALPRLSSKRTIL